MITIKMNKLVPLKITTVNVLLFICLINTWVLISTQPKRLTNAKLFASSESSRQLLRPKLATNSTATRKLVCYYTNWSQYRVKDGKFLPEHIDPHICTHIIFAFGWMKKNKLSSFDATDETKAGKKGLYERVTDLKKQNPNLKVLLAIGGWSFGTERFKSMANNKYHRRVFIFSAMDYLRERNFDGLDLDWEFPRGTDDKKNFVELLKELREAFEAEAKEKKEKRLLLTVAVSAGAETIRGGYDVPAISAYCDFINVMSYDFHGKWESKTGHNAPLYASFEKKVWDFNNDSDACRLQLKRECESVRFLQDYGVKLWEKLGASKDKLVIGMGTYGRSFTLASLSNYGMNAPASGGGTAGEFTKESGFLAFYEICQMMKEGATYFWDDEQKVPYIVKGDQWVGFDDERSITEKMNWLIKNDYAGAMVWTIDMDAFQTEGNCAGVKNPLMNIMAHHMFGKSIPAGSLIPSIVKKAAAQPLNTPTVSPVLVNINGESKPVDSAMALDANLNATLIDKDATNARVICYYTNWSRKRPGQGEFKISDIDPMLCTHVIYAFAGLKDNKIEPTEENDEEYFKQIVALKEKNPNLKVMLAVGGWMVGPQPFKTITENVYRQTLFVFSAIEYLRSKGFDGLDLCYEFPRGPEDKARYTALVKELREAFEGEGMGAKQNRLILSAAVPASFEAIASGYDVPEINKYLDFFNIMTYDFAGDWLQQVGHNSPLFPLNGASAYHKKLTVDYSVSEWHRKGASKEKLVVGLPTYGRTFTLPSSNLTDIGAPVLRGGNPGPYTKETGFLSFFEICDLLKLGATLVWDNEQMVPYAYKDDQWVGFDDPRSFKIKVQWLKQAGYGGIMIWSIDMDDAKGTCMGINYPLINSAKEELKGYRVANIEAAPSIEALSKAKKEEIQCEEADGHISYHIDKKDCTMYYMCEGKRKHHMPCPQNLVFNINENVCDWVENISDLQCTLPKQKK